MLKCFWTVIFSLLLARQLGAATVRINTVATPIVQLINISTFSLVVDSPSGDGTSESAPAKSYVPVVSTGGSTNNISYNTLTPTANLPAGATVGAITGTLRVFLDTASVTGTEYLHVAIKDSSSSSYKVLNSVAVTVSEAAKPFDFTLASMCSAGAGDLDCAGLITSANPTTTVDALVYFYIGSSQDGNGNTIDPTSKADGVFYKIFLSNRIYSNTITLGSLIKGDGRLTAIYQGFSFENLNSVVAFDFAGNACGSLYGTSTGTNTITDQKVTSGEAIIRPLVNDQSYKFAIYFEDKFKFASLLSNCIEGTPQQIEALLKKNSCFLLTAGFGGDHPIISYFRNWRDEFLIQTYFGKKFISFYYEWGPQMAPFILKTPWLAKMIRGGARVAYWVLYYKIWLLAIVLGALGFVGGFTLRKIRLQGSNSF